MQETTCGAVAAGTLLEIETPAGTIYGTLERDSDLDDTFIVREIDTNERIRVNGWCCCVTVIREI